jgi:hypothetical protein
MQISNYCVTTNGRREKFLIVSIRQGTKEVKRVLDMNGNFRGDRQVKLRWDRECCTTMAIIPIEKACVAGLAVVLYDLAWSESHGFCEDPEDE